jgi:hypothetical protein
VTADEVYGQDPALRGWLEDRGVSYVLAIKGSEPLVPATRRSARATAIQLATSVPVEQWVACSAGHGAKGRRLYHWARIQLATPAAGGCARWLLMRRRRDGKLAFYACLGPASTSLVGLVRVAGVRWAIEEGFQQAKTEVDLDHYEVRLAGLVPAHHPGLVGPCLPGRHPHHGRHWRRRKGGCGGLTSQLGLLPLTVPEVRRLLVALVWTSPISPGFVLAWSRWRRSHQARARRAHYQRHEQQVCLEY